MNRKLDALFAEFVMGEAEPAMTQTDEDMAMLTLMGAMLPSPGGNWLLTTTGYDDGDKPIWIPAHATGNMVIAWRGVEKLGGFDLHFNQDSSTRWMCEMTNNGYSTCSIGETAAEALVITCLRIAGVKTETIEQARVQ